MVIETAPAGDVGPIKIEDEMRASYLDYAMSVIVSRALPDVRDGLKPVQRRILYAMWDMGIRPGSAYKKSARIVGEVLGKYHPHGDGPVYEAMVRLAQDFSLRYPLLDAQGNCGPVDNDPPAAMRYTEARLAHIAEEMLADIERNTVDFVPNFDGSLEEPFVLPARLPNLLVNGASGIAVGMATTNGEGPTSERRDAIRAGYAEGKGRVVVRARAHIEEMARGGRYQIVVSELPYQVNKAALVEKIADLVRSKRVDGISELRDESDRHGMRIVIELKREGQPRQVLSSLYKFTADRKSTR